MAGTKLMVRRRLADFTRMDRGRRGRRIYSFKVKLPLPEQRQLIQKRMKKLLKQLT